MFGGNLPLIAVGCVEGIAAVVLLGTGLQRKRKKKSGHPLAEQSAFSSMKSEKKRGRRG